MMGRVGYTREDRARAKKEKRGLVTISGETSDGLRWTSQGIVPDAQVRRLWRYIDRFFKRKDRRR